MSKQLYLLETQVTLGDRKVETLVELGDPSEEFDIIRITGSWFTENPNKRWDYEDHYDTVYKEDPPGQKKYTLWLTSLEAYYDVISRFSGIGWFNRLTFKTTQDGDWEWRAGIPQKRQSWTTQNWTSDSKITTVPLAIRVSYRELPKFREFLRSIPYKIGYIERSESNSRTVKTLIYK